MIASGFRSPSFLEKSSAAFVKTYMLKYAFIKGYLGRNS